MRGGVILYGVVASLVSHRLASGCAYPTDVVLGSHVSLLGTDAGQSVNRGYRQTKGKGTQSTRHCGGSHPRSEGQIYTGFEREGASADALMLGHGLECDDAWAWRPGRCKGGVVIPALLPLLQTVWIVWTVELAD